MISADRFARVARAFPFLATAPGGAIAGFRAAAVNLRAAAGKPLFREGDAAGALPFVLAGSIRVFKVGRNGREITLYRFGAGETCILTANAILTGRRLPAAAVVEERLDAVAVPASSLQRWVGEHGLWRQFVFELLSDRLVDVLGIVDTVVFRRMDARVAELLLDRSRRQNPVRVTHQAIAAELGTSREVVSRIVEGIAAADLVRVGRGRIEVLDPGRLEAFVAG